MNQDTVFTFLQVLWGALLCTSICRVEHIFTALNGLAYERGGARLPVIVSWLTLASLALVLAGSVDPETDTVAFSLIKTLFMVVNQEVRRYGFLFMERPRQ